MEHFEKELAWIEDEGVRKMTEDVIKWIPDWFWHEPASSTGKYHPSYALGDGGLYRHTVAAMKIAHCLLELEFFQQEFDMLTRSYIMAAILLHDCCKRGFKDIPSKHTLFEHPLIVNDFLKSLLKNKKVNDDYKNEVVNNDYKNEIVNDDYVNEVSHLVSTHMGQWNTSKYSSVKLPKPMFREEKFVHMCDYLASRKFLEVNFDD